MKTLKVLFSRSVDYAQDLQDRFDLETHILDQLGLDYYFIPLELIADGRMDEVIDLLPHSDGQMLLYRGWMLREDAYEELYESLLAHGNRLVVDPDQYALTHYIPNNYEIIRPHSATTHWIWGEDVEEAWQLLSNFNGKACILKDHVKSAKENWSECCFIPPQVKHDRFVQICENFLRHQGERFERGFVIKEFLDLRKLPVSDPFRVLPDEYRLFFFQNELISACPYYEYGGDTPDFSKFLYLGDAIDSPFFSADVARLDNGELVIIELGDGGVTSFPPDVDISAVYQHIYDNIVD